MIRLTDIPLREKKSAQTRLALLNAMLERLDEVRLDEIPVRDLCDVVQISQGTFFNYFTSKDDLLTYFIQLWTIDMAWKAALSPEPPLRAIESIFIRTAESVADHPRVMLALIAHQANMPPDPKLPGVSVAERLIYFGEHEGIENFPAEGFETIVPRLLQQAVTQEALPKTIDIQDLTLALAAIFFGTALILARVSPEALVDAYRRQLERLWAGVHHQGEAT